ncbi:MAG: cation-transporting P-type ATPase, partial [Burkholderiaceae bacterium]
MIGLAEGTGGPDELLAQFGGVRGGLDSAQAKQRLAEQGPNEVEPARSAAALHLLAHQFASPLVLILVLAAFVSLFLRNWTDAAIILAIVLGSTLLG